jgi:hypothetical protein
VDVIVVDEQDPLPVGRPWLTLSTTNTGYFPLSANFVQRDTDRLTRTGNTPGAPNLLGWPLTL